MNSLKDILLQSTVKNLKESLLLKRAYKEIVNEKIVNVTIDLLYKNNTLCIYVKDNVWATQLMQYKHTILKRAKEVVKTIKDVKILVSFDLAPDEQTIKSKKTKKDITNLVQDINNCDSKYRTKIKKIIINSERNYEHVCAVCGSPVLSKKTNFCSLCLSQNKAIRKKGIQEILKETPWVKYEEIEQNQKKIMNYEGFMQEKKFKINRICDIIEKEYIDIQKNRKPNTEFFKSKIEELVILKISIEPTELTKENIENNIPKKWFKLYQS